MRLVQRSDVVTLQLWEAYRQLLTRREATTTAFTASLASLL
jgi:hypothetical protein